MTDRGVRVSPESIGGSALGFRTGLREMLTFQLSAIARREAMNPLRRLFSEDGVSASPASTRTRDARRRARFLPLGESLETRRVLSTFKVNTLLDTVAVNLKTGKDASGHISLRSAIEAANSRRNADTILLPAGTIRLTIVGANEDNAATGDLDIKGNVTIKGEACELDDHRRQFPGGSGFPGPFREGANLGIDHPARPGRPRGWAFELRRRGDADLGRGREQRCCREQRRRWLSGQWRDQ